MEKKKTKKVTTPEFRASFPHLFEAHSFQEGQQKKYSIVMLIPKTADISPLKEARKDAITQKWPDPEKRPKPLRNPIRDGDVEKPDTDGYPGHYFITASSKQRPGVVDKNVQQIIDDSEFYAGCYARATVTPYAYDTMGNRGVAFGLQNVQKLRDGDSFTGRSKAEDDFGVVSQDEDFGTDKIKEEEDMFE